jgi:IS605 OrfB family transposase
MTRSCWRTSWPSPTFSVPGSMERDPISRGNAIQKSARNTTATRLLITQLKILMISGCDQNLTNPVLEQLYHRMNKINEFKESMGSLSKTQTKQLDNLEGSIECYMSGGRPTEDLIDLLKEQDKLTEDLAERVVTTEKHVKRAKRVRIVHMDKDTKHTLRRYMTASRKIFNTALDLHNKGFRGEELRKRCVRGKFIHTSLQGVPEHVRQKAFDKYSSSMNATKELGGNLSFISRKKDESWVGFQKRDCKIRDETTLKVFKNLGMNLSEKVDPGIQCDIEITEAYGVFYATITENKVILPVNPPDIYTSKVCALDMGERTFGTLYDPDGTIAFLGTDVNTKVKNRLRVIYKKRNGLKTKSSYKKRSRILKACRRASAKLKNMIKDMHHRVADWLVKNYDVVLIGRLGINVMKCKRKGKRVLQSLSHYSFRRTLLQKATLARRVVRVVSEAYTTKQCNRCGYMNWTIGSSEVFSCKNCGTVCHRDVHSGRGIFIRSLSE